MMADKEESEVLSKIQDTYVPFLKKLIAFLEKNKKATPENLSKLKTIYTIFTTASPQEQVETFHANEKKLQSWYNKSQKEKNAEDGRSRGSKRSFVTSDTESSQGASDATNISTKKVCTFSNSVNSDSTQNSLTQIKKEKMSPVKAVEPTKAVTISVTNSQPPPANPAPTQAPEPTAAVPSDGPITFTCASCQFQTTEETEFMKHARTDHRTDLSMWCKQCGKCFSNAGVLVSHIKERACIKEEMIYRCGVKDCVFETTSGQTFVHHLRHCHKGSPFIFCVHCQKIFTLPHCLILHMQDDCPFKDKNRRAPASGGASAQSDPKTTQSAPVQPRVNPNPVAVLKAQSAVRPPIISYTATPRVTTPAVQPTPVVRTPAPIIVTPRYRGRGGGRGRGRGRGRMRISDSSDSDDPDDPSWRPEELLGETGLRRSGRWAKKINDVMNPEPSTSGFTLSSSKKSFVDADIHQKMINCPCCDFMAAFESVLEDHYIANHKVPNKNACLVCHLKFESTRAFFDHFEQHRSGSLPSKPPGEVVSEVPKQVPKQIDVPEVVHSNSESVSASVSASSNEVEPFDGVLTSIAGANLTDPAADNKVVIPYQAAIHDRNMKDSKLKKFEELKSPKDLITMKMIEKLKHFFKCGIYNCVFTTHKFSEFADHLKFQHVGKRYHCCYCLKEDLNSENITKHIAFKHSKRIYQCSKCFYRAYSKAHIQIHIKNGHSQDTFTEILVCDPLELPDVPYEETETAASLNTTWPYVCAIGECAFSTYDPKEFKKHNETAHRLVSVFICHYCRVDFLTFKRLINHYRLHGLNVFQCNYCIHGAETREEIMLHLCNAHADEPLKAYMRGSEEEATSEMKLLNSVVREETNGVAISVEVPSFKQTSLEKDTSKKIVFTGCENELYHIIDNACFPKNMQSLCYPRYLKNLLSDVTCGVPFCNEKFETLQMYLNHLRSIHDASNYLCPYCPEVTDFWPNFKNHLLCHGSKLYACGYNDCEFYECNKDRVKEHKKEHEEADNSVVALREFSPTDEEQKLISFTIDAEFPDSKDAFTCLFCKYKSKDRNIMKNHMYKEMAYQRFDCSLCEKKCCGRKEIREHFLASHSDLDILCSADYNIQIETMIKNLLAHQQKFCNARPAEICDMCCTKFKNPLRLQSHVYICLQKEYRPYECSHCNKNFVNPLALKYHTDDEHHPKCIEYSTHCNSSVEEDIEKNLLKIRLKQLKDIFEECSVNHDVDEKSFKVKFYTCSDCAFEAYHKFNLERHNKLKHGGLAKIMKGRESNPNSADVNLSTNLDENSNDSMLSKNVVKRYSCGYCVKKLITIQEVEKHMRKSHTSKSTEFYYYFTPNTNTQFSDTDKNIYECAYCKSTRENLFSLKKHADLMHSEMEFKVRGFLSFTQSQSNYFACGYCYLKVESQSQLQVHSASVHPLLALKSIGGFQVTKSKCPNDFADDCSNKRVKFNSKVFVCSHCGGAFSSVEAVTSHSARAHSRLKLNYTKMDQSGSGAESTDLKFYKCEFCKFTSEKHFLEKHLASKHKMRVTCSYCNKRFEFASRLKEHHEVFHKGLPIKYSQETVSLSSSSGDSNINNNSSKSKTEDAVIPEGSHYGKKPEPEDLSSIIVHMKTKDGDYVDLPAVYVAERFNIFPEVVVEDCMKKDKRK